jgi:predicted O-methyltransferase YrrM
LCRGDEVTGMNGSTGNLGRVITRLRIIATRAAGLVLLGLSRRAASTADILRRKITKIQIRLEGLDDRLSVKPITEIPTPQIEVATAEPIAGIIASAEFAAAAGFFADNPAASRSLVSAHSQALLYCLIRNLKPDHVFEIGAFRAGTTEAICRALHANGAGMAHTVDPFAGEHMRAVLKHWPQALLRHVELYAMDSMAFYTQQERKGIHPTLVLVDGNHAYEFALFDIGCSARALQPGGFIFIDNIAQAGPFFAGRDFLSANPGWREVGSSAHNYRPDKAFDRRRATIVNTDFMVLRAPPTHWIDERPRNFNALHWWRSCVTGVRMALSPPNGPGVLSVQVVLRGFGTQLAETLAETTVQIAPGTESLTVPFMPPARLSGRFFFFTVEPWLIWRGPEPLQLVRPPEPF